MVTQRMSPLGVAHWKFEAESEMPQKWVIAANGDPTNEPPWGSTLKIETGAENIMPTPLAGGQEISFAPGMIFLAPVSIFNVLPQGGSFDYPPEGTITHF